MRRLARAGKARALPARTGGNQRYLQLTSHPRAAGAGEKGDPQDVVVHPDLLEAQAPDLSQGGSRGVIVQVADVVIDHLALDLDLEMPRRAAALVEVHVDGVFAVGDGDLHAE